MTSSVEYVYISELYPDLNGIKVCADSVEKGFKGVWKYWCSFCQMSNMVPNKPPSTSVGLDLYIDSTFLVSSSEHSYHNYNKMVINNYFSFIKSHHSSKCTPNLLKISRTFFNSHLKAEFYCKWKKEQPALAFVPAKLSIGDNKIISDITRSVRQDRASNDDLNMIDLHADIDNRISDGEFRKMMLLIFQSDANECVHDVHPLYKLMFGAIFFESMSESRRGEEYRLLKLQYLFYRKIDKIGPYPGTYCPFRVTNKSKKNKEGRLEYVGAAPNVDSYRDHCLYRGMLWLYRFVVLGEKIPDFHDYKQYFNMPVYRQISCPMSSLEYRDYYRIWTSYYSAGNVCVDKVTHQPRRQAMQELDDANIVPEKIARHTGHGRDAKTSSSKVMNVSYLTNCPISCMVSRALGDPKYPRNHQPAHTTVNVPDELLCCFESINGEKPLSHLLKYRETIRAEFQNCKSMQERKEKRLYVATNAIDSIICDIQNALRCLSSIPVDGNTFDLKESTLSIYETHRNGDFHCLFSNPAFESSYFQQLQKDVKSSQVKDKDTSSKINDESISENERVVLKCIVPLERMLRSHIKPNLDISASTSSADTDTISGSIIEKVFGSSENLTLSNKPRKKRKGVLQEDVKKFEVVRSKEVPRPISKNSDIDCRNASNFFELWQKFRPLEAKWGNAWRVDLPIIVKEKKILRNGDSV